MNVYTSEILRHRATKDAYHAICMTHVRSSWITPYVQDDTTGDMSTHDDQQRTGDNQKQHNGAFLDIAEWNTTSNTANTSSAAAEPNNNLNATQNGDSATGTPNVSPTAEKLSKEQRPETSNSAESASNAPPAAVK